MMTLKDFEGVRDIDKQDLSTFDMFVEVAVMVSEHEQSLKICQSPNNHVEIAKKTEEETMVQTKKSIKKLVIVGPRLPTSELQDSIQETGDNLGKNRLEEAVKLGPALSPSSSDSDLSNCPNGPYAAKNGRKRCFQESPIESQKETQGPKHQRVNEDADLPGRKPDSETVLDESFRSITDIAKQTEEATMVRGMDSVKKLVIIGPRLPTTSVLQNLTLKTGKATQFHGKGMCKEAVLASSSCFGLSRANMII